MLGKRSPRPVGDRAVSQQLVSVMGILNAEGCPAGVRISVSVT